MTMRASLPTNSRTSQVTISSRSFSRPEAARTVLPATCSRTWVVGLLPPPTSMRMKARSTLKGLLVRRPVEASALRKVLTSRLPMKPETCCWPGSVPVAGSVPKASPSTVQLP